MFAAVTATIDGSRASADPLRAYADRVQIGTVVLGYDFREQDPLFRDTMTREFSMFTIGNDLKWAGPGVRPLRPTRDGFDFQNADELVGFAESHGMRVRGHTLVWHEALPSWLTEGQWTRADLVEILREHIITVVGRYRGRIAVWDVVNEAVQFDGSLRDSFWLRGIGPDYIEMAFRWAHEADPGALLFLNDDNGEGLGRESDGIYALVSTLRQRGVPIHGVGLEMHLDLDFRATGGAFERKSPADVAANMRRLGGLGLQVQVTEMDVRVPTAPTPADLIGQADVYRSILEVCNAVPACTAFVIWGFTDRFSWIPDSFPGLGAALIFDENYNPGLRGFKWVLLRSGDV